MSEHESVHVHLGKIGHDVQQGFRDMKLVLNRIKAEHRADTVAMQIASISQCFIDMHAKAQAIYELEWYPQDLVFAAKDLQQAYKQIGDTYAKARKVNQFLSSMRQCIRDKTGQLGTYFLFVIASFGTTPTPTHSRMLANAHKCSQMLTHAHNNT